MEQPGSEHEKEKIERLKQVMYSRALSDKLHPRDRRELEEDRPVVGDDWKRVEPEMSPVLSAPRGIGVFRTILTWLLVLAVVFFLGAVGFFAYYFTLGAGSTAASPQNIDVVITAPTQITSGELTQLQIAVTNRNAVPLELADLVIHYPSGTRPPAKPSIDPLHPNCSTIVGDELSMSEQRICLGTINPGETRQGQISAIFAGLPGKGGDIKAELEYHVSGSNSVFVASTDRTLDFSSAPLSVAITGNTQAISGQKIQLTAIISSNATTPLKDVLLQVRFPFGFSLATATPAAASNGFWTLGDITAGSKRTVTFSGTLLGEAGDDRVFNFSVGTRATSSAQTISTHFSDIAFHTSISQPFLSLALSVNDGSDPNVVVSPGDKVQVAVKYQNNLPVQLTNAVVVARLSGIQIDGTTVTSNDGFYRSSDDTVFWDKTTTNGTLATLAPGAKGTLSFSFQMPQGDALKGLINPRLDISINAAGNRINEDGVPQILQSTARQRISLASQLELFAQGLYYTNPFGSTGPIPPKAGTDTTYAIVFTVRNTTNKISNAVVHGILPPYVRWTGKRSPPSEVDSITFNQADSSFTWKVGDVEPGVGLGAIPPRQAEFSIAFSPSDSQIGQQPPLIQHITLTGMDASSSAPVSLSIEDITTNLAKVSKSSDESNVAGDTGFSASNAAVVK